MKIKIRALLMKKHCERADFLGEFNPELTSSISFDIPEGATLLQLNIEKAKEE